MNASDVLDRFAFFRNLPEKERLRGTESLRLARLSSRAFFFRQGQRIDRLGFVGSGSLRVFRVGESGREITLYHVKAGETCLVNLLSVVLRQEACATAQAEGEVVAAILPGNLARSWIRSSDAFRNLAFASLGRRLIDVMTLVEEIAFRKMDQRLADFLRQRATSDSRIESTHEAIAAELGTAREVVSRLLASFSQQGAISMARGSIRITQPELLPCERWGVPVTKSQTPLRPGS